MAIFTETQTIKCNGSVVVCNSAASTGTLTIKLGALQGSAGTIAAGDSKMIRTSEFAKGPVPVTFEVTGSVTYEVIE